MLCTEDFHDLLDFCMETYNSSEIGIRNNLLGQESVFTLDLFGILDYEKEGIYSICIDNINKCVTLDVDLYYFRLYPDEGLYDIDCFVCSYKGFNYKYYINIVSSDMFYRYNIKYVDFRYEEYDEKLRDCVNILEFLSIKDNVNLHDLYIYCYYFKDIKNHTLLKNVYNSVLNFTFIDINEELFTLITKNDNRLKLFYPISLKLDTNQKLWCQVLNFIWENKIKLTSLELSVDENNFDTFYNQFRHHLNNLNILKNKNLLINYKKCAIVISNNNLLLKLQDLDYFKDFYDLRN